MDLDQGGRHVAGPVLDACEQIVANIHRSPGVREQQRAIPGAGEWPQLLVTR